MNRTPLRDRTHGRWLDLLARLGVDTRYLSGKNGPCLFCGGRDRWRFLDKGSKARGYGNWICNQCGSGDGIDLLMKYRCWTFCETAREIESIIGDIGISPGRPRDEQRARERLNSLWSCASSPRKGDATDQWLISRGIDVVAFPSSLRTGLNIRYYPDNSQAFSLHPAMLAKVTDPAGKPVTIHKTYLTANGSKAPVEKPRKLAAVPFPKGGAVRLAAPSEGRLGVAEGIETALAASALFKVPTWAAISATFLENFEPPADVSKLIIFGDNDANHVGQTAAHTLASRVAARATVEVHIPERPGTDWNDVLLEQTCALAK
jgi:putative DNA primase/helicase